MKAHLQWFGLAALLVLLGACAATTSAPAPRIVSGAQWVILPIANHTDTPQAGARAEAIAETLLRVRGVSELRRYPVTPSADALFEDNARKAQDEALTWARQQPELRYALTGSVQEWRYKVGLDGEPAIGLDLQVIDLQSQKVIWSAGGAKTGWGRESLAGVAQELMDDLLANLVLR